MNNLLKFVTCGSVDDGKSTLIGHMLYDAKLIFADQERALELESKVGSRGGEIDYSLLLDGLMAEREQGITIDVAYRYFTTQYRSFIVADAPGHEEYTRNMAVAAAFADLAVILVDASQGVLVQTRRHARICSMMGIRHFVFAVNKMDLVHFSKETFDKIKKTIKILMAEFNYESLVIIPVSATEGDNITEKSDRMPWYKYDTLLTYLEKVDVTPKEETRGFTMPVERVSRPNRTFRGFEGEITSGTVHVGDLITSLPSMEQAHVKEILDAEKAASFEVPVQSVHSVDSNHDYARRMAAWDLHVQESSKGHAVTITLDREIDTSRGCVFEMGSSLEVGSLFVIHLLWMDDHSLVAGRNFWLKIGTQQVPVTVMKIRCKIDVNSGAEVHTDEIFKNEIAVCEISTGTKIVFDRFENNREMGSLILIDRVSNMTSACGTVIDALERGNNLTWQDTDITRSLRESQKSQKGATVWMTGLSGSGKSTLANALEKRLFAMDRHTMLLDGDNIRMGLCRDLSFSEADRIENIRRIANVAKLMNDAGLIVMTAIISPFRQDRQRAREIIGDDSFFEVYVSTPLEECEKRDVKGLYKKARSGQIRSFTGISSPYEAPENPDIIIDTSKQSVEDGVEMILKAFELRFGKNSSEHHPE